MKHQLERKLQEVEGELALQRQVQMPWLNSLSKREREVHFSYKQPQKAI